MNNTQEFDKHILISVIEKLNSCIIMYPHHSLIFNKYANFCIKNNTIFNRNKIIDMIMVTQYMKNVTHTLDFIFTFLTKEQINEIYLGKTILDIALDKIILQVSFDCVKSLINNGANVLLTADIIPPFYKMITHSKLKNFSDLCIEVIDKLNIDPYVVYGKYTTMEHIMRCNDVNYAILDKFVSMGYGFDHILPNSDSLLMSVVEYRSNYIDVYILIEYLIKNKCDIHHKNNDGENVLSKLFRNQYASEDVKKSIKLLVENGININVRIRNIPLIFRIIDNVELYDCLDLFDIFYNKGIDYNMRYAGMNILNHACNQILTNKKTYIVKKLLENGCEIDCNEKGLISFYNIVRNENKSELVKILMEKLPWENYVNKGKKIHELCLPEYVELFKNHKKFKHI